jgi:hypothetical protein
MISHVDPQFSRGAWRYVSVVKLVCIPRTCIFVNEKCLEHYHILDIAERCYDMQLIAIELDQQRVGLHDPNN